MVYYLQDVDKLAMAGTQVRFITTGYYFRCRPSDLDHLRVIYLDKCFLVAR